VSIDDNRRRTDLFPRQDIPDAWGAKGRCPMCGKSSLQVMHLSKSPDYLLCSSCDLSFEIEKSSGIIRLKNIPEELGFVEDELRYNWVQPATLRNLMENRNLVKQQKAIPAAREALSDEDVWNRMLSLYKMGNKPKMIGFMLIQNGATKEQVEAAALKLKKWSEQDEKQQKGKLWVLGVITLLLVMTIFLGGLAFTSSQIDNQLSQGRGSPQGASQPSMPLVALNSLPDIVKPEFMKGSPLRVENVGPDYARCPTNSTNAAKLFGGDAAGWQPGSQPESWQMITTGKPATIRIPKGMYVGFIDNKTFVFTTADGPATIYNVNFAAISCQ